MVSKIECLNAASGVCSGFNIDSESPLVDLTDNDDSGIPCGCFLWEEGGQGGKAFVAYNGGAICNDGSDTRAHLVCKKEPEEENPFQFDGVVDIVSFEKGEIDVFWDPPTYFGEFENLDLEAITYHVFVALGEFDFKSELGNSTIEVLIDDFSSDISNQMQYASDW